MQTTSSLYKTILADPSHIKVWKAVIDGTEYLEDQIVSIRISRSLYGNNIIGGTYSSGMTITLKDVPSEDIPKMAKIQILVKLMSNRLYGWKKYDLLQNNSHEAVSLSFPDGYDLTIDADRFYEKTQIVGDVVLRVVSVGSMIFYTLNGDFPQIRVTELEMLDYEYGIIGFKEVPPSGWAGTFKIIKGKRLNNFDMDVASSDRHAYPDSGEVNNFWYDFSGYASSEWLPKGTYWVNQRRENKIDETIELTCVDGMMFGEQMFYPEEAEITDWNNKTMREVARMCAQKMSYSTTSMTLERETDFQNAAPYVITAPPIGYTVRQVLSAIAISHCGNIIVTENNQLRLVPFYSVPDESHILTTEQGVGILFGGDRIVV